MITRDNILIIGFMHVGGRTWRPILQLDGAPLLLEGLVIGMLPQAGQLVGLGDPLIAAQGLGDQLAQAGVAVGQPAAGRHPVGLVLELLRE